MRVVIKSVVIGLVAGAAWGTIARSHIVARQPFAAAASPVSTDSDGPLVTVGLEPAAIVGGPAGETLEFQLSLTNRSARTSSFRYSYEVVDDQGGSLQQPVISPLASVAAAGVGGARIATPPGLADGVFEVRVMVAAADGASDTLQIAERYFAVHHGAVTPITRGEWVQSSNASQEWDL